MTEEEIQVEDYLREIILFKDLDEDQLSRLVDRLETMYLEEGTLLFVEGEPGDSMYVIFEGDVLITQGHEEEEVAIATMGPGEFFGEESMLYNIPRSTSVRALSATTLLRLDSALYSQMVERELGYRPTLKPRAEDLGPGIDVDFDWLNPEEYIYLLRRKHPAVLWISLTAPVFVLLLALPVFFLAYLSQTITPFLCGVLIVVAAVAWAIWRIIDWFNDYYIVTNQRVVWLEKIIGIYDSRQEAPLRTLLSVSVETDLFGRAFGFGDVIVRTYTSRIIMEDVGEPQEFGALIEQFWMKTKNQVKDAESDEMVRILRDELGLPTESEDKKTDGKGAEEDVEELTFFRLLWANYFQMRYQHGSIITYRKHWWILLKKSWFPLLCLFIVIVLMVASVAGAISLFSGRTMWVVGIALLMVFGGWWLYRFVDWRNDMFQLTPDHIVDIDRTPLGSEQKQAAPLENILSLEHVRLGIPALIFNYGTVFARIGKADFTFDDVHNPAQVQQDIFARMDERINQKRKLDEARERARLAGWLAAYHRNVEDIREDERELYNEEER